MAEQIPYGVVVNIISKLASLAFREFGRVYGVTEDLEKLKDIVECIQAELSDAEERQHVEGGAAVKVWIRRLRDVVHDADNLFDELLFHDLQQKVKPRSQVRVFLSSKNQLVFRRKMAAKAEKIRKKFDDVSSDMSKLNLSRRVVITANESGVISWRETSSLLPSDIIGREEDKSYIVDLLKQTNTNQNVSVIAIVGMGGLGKTALAQMVYNDADVQKLFQKRTMWVCVSEDFEVQTVLSKILESPGGLPLEQLRKKIQEKLNGQRYMLVLDDVWDECPQKWDALNRYLTCGAAEGSKILVTTRSKRVAQAMGINDPYVLKGLTEGQSWDLLKKVIFGGDDSRIVPNLVTIGEEIAKKCRGVPLAIRTVGGVLQSNYEDSKWKEILHGEFWRSYGEKDGIMPVLKLSYQNLPPELRQCFAYCSLFPKDRKIHSGEIIQLWMAQGYLGSSIETPSMEDVGYQYVKNLLMKSFFQNAYVDRYGDIVDFKMHDLMHDLATSVAANDCCVVSEGEGITGRPMHVSFVSGSGVCSLDVLNTSKLRTLMLKVKDEFLAKPFIISNLKYLRALNLSGSSITKLPESIDKCKHLRHLDLSLCSKLISLPESFGNLVLLQTLKLGGCYQLAFCIEVITKLISLRHLDIRGCKPFDKNEMVPAGIGKLTSLQCLPNFAPVAGCEAVNCKSGKLNALRDFNNIRGDIRITNLALVEDVLSEPRDANLKAKKGIRYLELTWGEHRSDRTVINKNSDSFQLLNNLCPHENLRELWVCGYPGERFSDWLPSLTYIRVIHLGRCSHCRHLPPLERLPYLKKLDIWFMGKLECIYFEKISHDAFFPSLEELSLYECEHLKGWQRLGHDDNANDIDNHLPLPPFPHLSSLTIIECPNLTCMPSFAHLVEKLVLRHSSVKPMAETFLVRLESVSVHPLSALKRLEIGGRYTAVETMAEGWMQSLTSLEHLSLWGSPTVQPLLWHLRYLRSELRTLEIEGADDEKLNLWKDEEDNDTQCPAPPHALRSLREFSVKNCGHLKALPEQIGDLQSLTHIRIYYADKLESLPKGMRRLTNLQSLHILDCPLLHDRCQAQTGEDWPKIAHIPNLIISRY